MIRFLIPEPKDRRSGGTLYDLQMVEAIHEKDYKIKTHWIPQNNGVNALIVDLKKDDFLIIDGLVFHQNYSDAILLEGFEKTYITHLPFWLEPGIDDTESKLRKQRELDFIKKCNVVVCTSHFISHILIKSGIPIEKIIVISPRTTCQPVLKRTYKKAPTNLLVVGSVHFGKGLDILIKALEQIEYKNWHLNIAGDINPGDTYFKSINREIEKSGFFSKIRFLGACNAKQISALYRNSDLLIHPSRFESFGMAIGEALCSRLPSIVSDAGALPSVYNSSPIRFFKSEDVSSLVVLLNSVLSPKGYQEFSYEFKNYNFKSGNKDEYNRLVNSLILNLK